MAGDARYEQVATALIGLAGEKVRLTYALGTKTGVVTTRDYGHCVDVMLDGRGGMSLGACTKIEVKRGARYEVVEEAGGAGGEES